MLIFLGVSFARDRRPYQLVFFAFWALLLDMHVEGREDLYPTLIVLLVVGFVMKQRDPVAISRHIRRKFERAARSVKERQ